MSTRSGIELALYQPDIAANAGTILRLAACVGAAINIIEPAGFPSSDYAFRRAGLDYLQHVEIHRHVDFAAFMEAQRAAGRRLVLLTTAAELAYTEARFLPCDTLMLGRESAGVPDSVHEAADLRLRIPMRPAMRSINVAMAGAMVLGEALRQTGGFPSEQMN